MKARTLILAMLCCLILTPFVSGAGITFWSVTDQLIDIDESASVAGRIGYYTGGAEGGVEFFVGSTWHPDTRSPQVMSFGILEHLPDLIDPQNPLPFIPKVLLTLINEEVELRPYAGLEATFNFIDEDAGFYGPMVGLLGKLTPKSKIETGAEACYFKGFGDLEDVDEFQLRIVMRILF